MDKPTVFEEEVNQDNLIDGQLPIAIYEHCTFKNITIQQSDISQCNFVDCTFVQCDFSFVKCKNTIWNNCTFNDCRLMSINWPESNSFALKLHFEDCILDYCFFNAMNLQKTDFKACSLQNVDFTESNLKNSSFSEAQLTNAIFEYTDLESADFSSAVGFEIDPDINKITNASFSMNNVHRLLSKYKIKLVD